MQPRRLNDRFSRQIARRTRDGQWDLMRRLARQGIVHICTWNKKRRPEGRNEIRYCLMGWFEDAAFIRAHRNWFGRGPWDDARDTFPMWLTPAGRAALKGLPDDRKPVFGGLVEPGYQCIPLDFHRDLNEQRARNREVAGLSRPSYIRERILKAEPIAPFRKRGNSRSRVLRKAA